MLRKDRIAIPSLAATVGAELSGACVGACSSRHQKSEPAYTTSNCGRVITRRPRNRMSVVIMHRIAMCP